MKLKEYIGSFRTYTGNIEVPALKVYNVFMREEHVCLVSCFLLLNDSCRTRNVCRLRDYMRAA